MNEFEKALKKMCEHCESLTHKIPTKVNEDSIEIHECGHQMCPYRTISNDYCEEYDTLQELIKRMNFVDKVQTPDYLRVQNENEMLERALDKACWHLQEYEKDLKKIDINQPTDTKEEWKEYLLESVKQQ